MSRWAGIAALACVTFAHAQPIAPPIPDGPPIEMPKPAVRPASATSAVLPAYVEETNSVVPHSKLRNAAHNSLPWWEEEASIIPAGGLLHHHGESTGEVMPRPWHPSPPPAAFAGSSCDFNAWCGANVFSPDFHSLQFLGGYYESTDLGPRIPTFGYAPLTVRKGWMLTAPDDHTWLFHGNWECLAGLAAGPITSSYGSIFASPTVHIRRNYVWEGSPIVPYSQLGVGLFFSDAYKDKSQRAIGQTCEYTLQAALGVRCFVTDRMSVDLEIGYQHITNANQADRNYGVNAVGAQIGVTYHFPWGQ